MKVKLLKLMICPFCEGKLECFIKKSVIKLYNDDSFNQSCASKCRVIETNNHSINLNGDCVECHNLHIKEGHLYCEKCVKEYPVIKSIPRFFDLQESNLCRDDVTGNTSESFSLQWEKMRKYYEYGMEDFIKDILENGITLYG